MASRIPKPDTPKPGEPRRSKREKPFALAALELARGLLELPKDRKAAIGEMTPGFPPLSQLVRYSEYLGATGYASKRWRGFAEVYGEFMQFAHLEYEDFRDDYDKLYPDHALEEKVWYMMCDHHRQIVEDVIALLVEIMPETKRFEELDGESKERTIFMQALARQERKKRTDPRLEGLLED